MVSVHKHAELETTLHKKRKPNCHEDDEDIGYETIGKSLKTKTSKFQEVVHLQTPLPFEWQRCLDMKANESSSRDPRIDLEAPPPRKRDSFPSMSLDLDLHLPCGSHPKDNFTDDNKNKNNSKGGGLTKIRSPLSLSSSWLTFEGDEQQKELVTAVCHKCHLLIMMNKASLCCPNCKFIHKPQDDTFPGLSL